MPLNDRTQIECIRRLALAQLVELRASPKPTYKIDGQTVSWESYMLVCSKRPSIGATRS